MTAAKRSSGIALVGEPALGQPLLPVLYQTKKDMTDIVVPYFRQVSKATSFASGSRPTSWTKHDAAQRVKEAVPASQSAW